MRPLVSLPCRRLQVTAARPSPRDTSWLMEAHNPWCCALGRALQSQLKNGSAFLSALTTVAWYRNSHRTDHEDVEPAILELSSRIRSAVDMVAPLEETKKHRKLPPDPWFIEWLRQLRQDSR
ncbi:hypothetical protein NDU88_006490 [Pleurodeles waltl]|uniref:Uncharacterized protein n=1 Tax=Pleurodeles waltl TaxID=8319 RepID=A0AAV7ULM7_PLEWA|nr:hypothetical protein NDU88_006490 [Pleurodeles waltl]